MELKNAENIIVDLLKESKISEYFSVEEIKDLTDEMLIVVEEVIGNTTKLKEITFYNDEENYFDIVNNTVHFGIAVIKNMITTWEHILTDGGKQHYLPGMLKYDIKNLVKSSLKSLAAHEAGHRVIDKHPVTDMGLTQEEWGQLGISSLANALMDCRDDGRVAKYHPDLNQDVKIRLKYKFGPNGPLDWPSYINEQMLKQGYRLRFTEFDCETIRWWNMGVLHPQIDKKVSDVLQKHQKDITFISSDNKCVPKREPSELEVKSKGQLAYREVAEIYKGDYQNLIDLDRDNQSIHQAISIIGLYKNNEELPKKVKNLLESELKKLDKKLSRELEENLEKQRTKKKEHFAIEHIEAEISKKLGKTKEKNEVQDDFELLGPAIPVEELSDELRQWLKNILKQLQEDMQEEMTQELLNKLIQQLLENPEKFLKQVEDELNKKLRSPMTPSTHPTHEELEKMEESDEPQPPSPILLKPGVSKLPKIDIARLMPHELQETEDWLNKHVDIQERIDAWKEAIYSQKQGGYVRSNRPTSKLHGPSLVQEDIRKRLNIPSLDRIFLDKSKEREKITLSILWRTQAVPVKEALKLFVFLLKIYEDDEIRRYLDLEILISQKIIGLKDDPISEIPVVISFDDDPIIDYEKILSNLLAIQKTSNSGGAVQIVEDATALQTQRDRLLKQNPKSKMRFPIDLWDEAAIQSDSLDPLKAVQSEIETTQETFNNKAFCFVMNRSDHSSRGHWYGKYNYLAWSSTEKLIFYLDIVCRSMIKYNNKYASYIEDAIIKENL